VHAGAAEVRRRAGYANILYNLSGYYGQVRVRVRVRVRNRVRVRVRVRVS